MPIPFIIAGVAMAAAGYGAKKGYDAKCDFDDAKCDFDDAEYYNRKAKRICEEAQNNLNSSREQTNQQMELLGALKVNIYRETLANFVNIFSKIKNIDFEDNLDLGLSIKMYSDKDFLEIKKDVLKTTELITTAVGSGVLAGIGAFGGAGILSTASTGTAIGSLSGVAATNATLAWFGGGSLATGGLGMAGGMAVLGGIVAGPVIAVAGGMMAAKAETAKYEADTAKYEAEENLNKSKAYVEEMEIKKIVVEEIDTRVTEFINVLEPLKDEFKNYIDVLENIVDNSKDYSVYSEEDKKAVMVTVSIATTVKNICDVPIIDENGEITKKSKRALKTAKDFVLKLEEV